MTKTYFQEYQRITSTKFDLEDRIDTLGHDIWVMKNERLKAQQQLKKKENELRNLFNRQRLVFKDTLKKTEKKENKD